MFDNGLNMTWLSREARVQLSILAAAIVLGMAPWFAATVVAQGMSRDLKLTSAEATWLTLAVQLGFVAGSVLSAGLLLSDRLSPRRLAAVCVAASGMATAALLLPGIGPTTTIALRLMTGATLAGVYPPAIKMAAGWTESHRGTAIGLLVGALTLGTAAPHLLRLVADLSRWRPVLLSASLSAAASATVFWGWTREGPYQSPSAPFDPRALGNVMRNRGVLLSTGGYLGHMWELYAMWSSLGVFLADMVRTHGRSGWLAPLIAFTAIGVGGAIGCVAAGVLADRIGKSLVAAIALAVSGACALIIGTLVTAPLSIISAVTFIWGIAIVADSAQFSACVTILAPRAYVGTALTAQTALGFLLTMLTIRFVPEWATAWGWRWAYLPLAAGPCVGIVAMSRLWMTRRV
jgi:MFS family permease